MLFAIAGPSAAMASVPSPQMAGVQRVVITCDADSSLTGAEASEVCAQLVKKAQSATRLPVLGFAADKVADSVPNQGDQLVLHIALSATIAKSDRGTIAMTVTPSRNYLGLNAGAPIKSEAQLARLNNKLVVQGPVRAFAQILGAFPPELHRPIKSDL